MNTFQLGEHYCTTSLRFVCLVGELEQLSLLLRQLELSYIDEAPT